VTTSGPVVLTTNGSSDADVAVAVAAGRAS
jgi:hypothetical protein